MRAADDVSSEAWAFPADLPALTSVRFILAAGVAFFHYHLHWSFADTEATWLIERARLGVDVFFILSGFILTHVYHRQWQEGRYSHRRFLITRFARIDPMHAAGLALMLAMVLAGSVFGAEYDAAAYGWADFLRAATLTQAWWVAPPINQWNGPSWSLSAEWFAYLAFPLFAYLGVRLRGQPWLLIAAAVVSFVVLDVAYQAAFGRILPHAEEQLGVLRIAPEFLFGIGLYQLGRTLRLGTKPAAGAALAAAALLLSLMHVGADDRLIVLAAGPLILTLAMLSKGGDAGALAHPAARLLGEASYALYLLHLPILIAWRNVAVMLDSRPATYAMPLWEVLAVFAITVGASVVAHLIWERPARDAIRRWTETRRSEPPVSAAGSQPPDV